MSQAGFYSGRHYTEWVESVNDLKRNGDLNGAIALLGHLIEATEAEATAERNTPAPWYYMQSAIVFRKLKDPASEVAVLERYLNFPRVKGAAEIEIRLRKARTFHEDAGSTAKSEGMPVSCPACGVKLDPPPSSSRNCPHCDAKVVVRKERGQAFFLTEEQDQERKKQKANERELERCLAEANLIGCSDADFERTTGELRKEWGKDPSPGDVFWRLANSTAMEQAVANDFRRAALTYRQMADHVCAEGKDWSVTAHEGVLYELREASKYTEASTVMSLQTCGCDVCAADTRKISLAQALTNPQLPHEGCVNPPCTCGFELPSFQSVTIELNVSVPVAAPRADSSRKGLSGFFKRR